MTQAIAPDNGSRCVVCGCGLAPTDAACPVCGASAPADAEPPSPPSGRDGNASSDAPPNGLSPKGRRALIAVAAVAAIAVIGVLVVLFLHDQELRDQVASIDSPQGPAEQSAPPAVGMGNEPGAIAGGGVLVATDDGAFVARSSGVYLLDGGGDAYDGIKVSGDQAVYLNFYDGTLYYVSVPATSRDTSVGGTSIRMVAGATNGDNPGLSSRVLYKAENGALVSDLAVRDGRMYFLEHSGGSFAVKEFACDAEEAPSELDRFDAKHARLFAEGSTLYEVVVSAKSWEVRSRNLDSDGAFSTCAKGEGALLSACIHDGAFYYGLETHLFRNDLTGGTKEFKDVAAPVHLAASGDVVVASTKAGELIWLDVVTGFAHDKTADLKQALPNVVPTDLSLAATGSRLYLTTANDAATFLTQR